MTTADKKRLDTIVTLIKEAGYDPLAQITGYMLTGRETYITRQGGARDLKKASTKKR